MDYILVCVAGEHKGKAWPVTSAPLTLGRDPGCHIVLTKPSISRRHCQVLQRDGMVLLEDLGSRNLPLVNGRPVRHHTLHAGDDLFLGRDHFALTACAAECVPPEGAPGLLSRTLDWECAGEDCGGGTMARMRPRTVQDLAMLYEAVCEFSGCADPEVLLEIVQRHLVQYFNPDAVWIVRGRMQSRCIMWSRNKTPSEAALPFPPEPAEPRMLMERALGENRALLEHNGAVEEGQEEVLTYAAPVLVEGTPLAVLAVRTHTARDVHPDGGLHFIALFARSLAPVLYSADHHAALYRDNERLRVRMNESHTIVGDSEPMRSLRTQTLQAAHTAINVLITGETGVGKELVARALHDFSPRRAAPFVVVNCAAIPRELFEGELFGHMKGAYTDASSTEPGLLDQADGGTLFLDEIGDLSLDNQARILRVVENQTFRPVGSVREIKVDVRFIAATNKDLDGLVQRGRFRNDLYHRIRGLEIMVPPLREHPEDIPALAEHFLSSLRDEGRRPFRGFAPEVFESLRQLDWPGNVRELRHAVHRAMTCATKEVIGPEDILEPPRSKEAPPREDAPILTLERIEKQHIRQVLAQYGGNVRAAARALGISRTTLYNKINGRTSEQ
ncbi:MAG TPA: sigma 54-interacting transcriptional regulator [Candidatus Hydrogenedentes bacterium]|nr:sigma 54-dependent Fis family transcriptional regulator [Candidatus Hydrogenedentota bacterium]HOC69676.1 sigma 54-interacting transcriptional regulator [Candidatus Hydrogenedentota bacterium]